MIRDCKICDGQADIDFKREEVWSNERWRLTASRFRAVKGLCYLEPKRHIPYITELEGEEAKEFETVLRKVCSAIKCATDAKLVYIYVYGDHIPHLHIHLAPHSDNDIYVDQVVKDEENMSTDEITDSEFISLKDSLAGGLESQ
jgi:diadenosine tetraphosphate (Ap4A) HIT family hydrolase